MRNKNQNNQMVKHMAMEQNEEEPLFVMKLVRQFKRTIWERNTGVRELQIEGGENPNKE